MKNYEKYDLGKMEFNSSTFRDGTVEAYKVEYDGKIIHRKRYDRESRCYFYQALEDFTNWLNSKVEILDEKEKEYLSAVIKPFKQRVLSIRKMKWNDENFICVKCKVRGLDWAVSLPPYKNSEMYAGMKLQEEYTLEELGL